MIRPGSGVAMTVLMRLLRLKNCALDLFQRKVSDFVNDAHKFLDFEKFEKDFNDAYAENTKLVGI